MEPEFDTLIPKLFVERNRRQGLLGWTGSQAMRTALF
jgi:hypothetical protein